MKPRFVPRCESLETKLCLDGDPMTSLPIGAPVTTEATMIISPMSSTAPTTSFPLPIQVPLTPIPLVPGMPVPVLPQPSILQPNSDTQPLIPDLLTHPIGGIETA